MGLFGAKFWKKWSFGENKIDKKRLSERKKCLNKISGPLGDKDLEKGGSLGDKNIEKEGFFAEHTCIPLP